ncbi:carbohydrate kinase family protein [Cohnella endophytica]|uniref:Carbohydrate kinase family protein n=1 Tax=Cohnella endophytica TaxID=2419778 RepID=A0A494XMJ7_9BACL|nr:carbohydrate kinase family protein [Cohnella endophytica]RKP49916.1 carbohydrate kinase family protein [Cohnella endophytica]
MRARGAEVIVAGHICLDIIPKLTERKEGVETLFIPGKLVNVGPAVIATGGAVSNTGIALHRLGSRVRLMGKIGDDPFGRTIVQVLNGYDPSLAEGMIVAPGEHSSYTMVISPPNVDRIFLHSTGANDTYTVDDVNSEHLQGARLFHFGYPPLMRRMYEEGGEELAKLLQAVKNEGLTVSLDLAMPDPESEAGRADWRSILERALPYTDVFLPSFEEIVYMLHRDRYEQWLKMSPKGDLLPYADGELLRELSEELLAMGAAIVAVKLGEHGLYVRTTADAERLAAMGACAPIEDGAANWLARELLATCFKVDVVGTTGAGDCTIAGFLSGLLAGHALEETLQTAVGVGACNVEKADAASGIPTLDEVKSRMASGWTKRKLSISLPGWAEREDGVWEALR